MSHLAGTLEARNAGSSPSAATAMVPSQRNEHSAPGVYS